MAAITVTNPLSALRAVFNKIDEVYYKSSLLTVADLATALTVDLELPVLEDGVTFNSGEPDTTEIKLTTGANWVTRTEKGDSDISLQVASLKGAVNDLFMEKKLEVSATQNLGSDSYQGAAYSLAPKKVSGSLIMMSDSKDVIVILTNIEMYGSLVVADGDNPAYFQTTVTPLENSDGAEIIILEKVD